MGLSGQREGYGGDSGVMGATEGLWVQRGDYGSKVHSQGCPITLRSCGTQVMEDALQGIPPYLVRHAQEANGTVKLQETGTQARL